MKPLEEAQQEVFAAFAPVGRGRRALLAALDHFAAEPVVAQAAAPPFDQSAMDGYALRADDTKGASPDAPVTLPVRGESRAGGPPPPPLSPATAMRIYTGAVVPEAADAVQLQEQVRASAQTIELTEPVAPHANIRRRATDTRPGTQLLATGDRIGSGEIALLASQDIASVTVFQKPRVAILATGDELRDIGEPDQPGRIVNSNGYALAAQVLEAGAEPWVLPIARDLRGDVADALRTGLRADVLLISGGVSVGDYDVVRAALAEVGVTLAFWKVNIKPGKPLAFGTFGAVPVLGLPGNPVSTWLSFELFARPGLRKMLGDPLPFRTRASVTMTRSIARRPGRTEIIRVRLSRRGGELLAEPLTQQGSGSLPSLARVDALALVPAEQATVGQGDRLEALVLRSGGAPA